MRRNYRKDMGERERDIGVRLDLEECTTYRKAVAGNERRQSKD